MSQLDNRPAWAVWVVALRWVQARVEAILPGGGNWREDSGQGRCG
jgi:hypothetical protein